MKQPMEDRLQAARRLRSSPFKIAGTELDLHKWNFDQTLTHAALLVDIVKLIAKDTRIAAIQEMLKRDFVKIMLDYGDKLKTIVADTIATGNFESPEEAATWLKEIPNEDFILLLIEIFRRNFSPLAKALGLNIELPGGPKSADQSAPETSSPTSSQT